MSEQRLERMEGMLTQLISTVGNIMNEQTAMREEQTAMRKDQKAMREEQIAMRKDQKAMREENDKHHQEVMNNFRSLEADQDHIWEKTARNEREFAKFKNLFET